MNSLNRLVTGNPIYIDTRKGYADKNTMLIHNTNNSLYNKNGYDSNTVYLRPGNDNINKNSLYAFSQNNQSTSLAHSKDFPQGFRSPLDYDNKLTLNNLRAMTYNSKKEPFSHSMDNLIYNSYSNNNINQPRFNLKQSLDNINKDKYYYNDQMIDELRQNQEVKVDLPDHMSNTPQNNNNLNINQSFKNRNNSTFQPIQGQPAIIESKCKNCKYITPKEVMEMIRRERESNEKQLNNYMEKLNKSVEKVMNHFKDLSDRVLKREEKLLAIQQNRQTAVISEEELERPIRTPIPILKPILKKKRYEMFRGNWKKIKYLARMVFLYLIFLKMAKMRTRRLGILYNRERTKENDYEIIKSFMVVEMKRLFEEFSLIKNMNLIFDEKVTEIDLLDIFSKINSLVRTFFKSLIDKTLKYGLETLPKKLLYVLYTYIVDKFYFHQTFLSSFEINRLTFNLYGEITKLTKSQRGMIIALLLINKVFIPYVCMRVEMIFTDKKDEREIQNYRYFGTILHYLIRDTFKLNPVFFKDRMNLVNYYRNYHLDDYAKFQTAMDNYDSEKDYGNLFEESLNLLPEKYYRVYLKYNKAFVEQFKDDLLNWAGDFGFNIHQLWENRKKFIKIEDIVNG